MGIAYRLRFVYGRTMRVRRGLFFVLFLAVCALAQAAVAAPYGSQKLIRLPNGRVGLTVAINGYGPFAFLIDTASSHTVLAPRVQQLLKIPASGGPTYPVVTAAGSVQTHFHMINEIAASGVIVEHVNAIVIDLPRDTGADGLIGADFLSNFTVDLDLGARTITLYPGGTVLQPAGFQRVAGVVNSAGFIVVPASVDAVRSSAVFDSGALFTVANLRLAADAQRLPKIIARPSESKVTDAARLRGNAESVNFSRISVGPAVWSDRRVLVSDMRVFAQVGLDDRPTLFLGIDMMTNRRVILDYAGGALWLSR